MTHTSPHVGDVNVKSREGTLSAVALPTPWGFTAIHFDDEHRTFAYAAWSDLNVRRRLGMRIEIKQRTDDRMALTGDRAVLEAIATGWVRYRALPDRYLPEVIAWELEHWAPQLLRGSNTHVDSGHVVVVADRRAGMGPGYAVTSVLFVSSLGLFWSAVDGSTARSAVVYDAIGRWRGVVNPAGEYLSLLTLEGEVGFVCERRADAETIRRALEARMPES